LAISHEKWEDTEVYNGAQSGIFWGLDKGQVSMGLKRMVIDIYERT
jgi:hypothetical protein